MKITREEFILDTMVKILVAREGNPDYENPNPQRAFEKACEVADLAEEKLIAPWCSLVI